MHELEAYGEGGIIAQLPQSFLDEFEKEIQRDVPKEKLKSQLNQEKLARIMRQAGSTTIDGIGQLVAKIDARTYFRNMAAHGEHEDWLTDLIRDNPQCRAPGYNPRRKGDLRHGITFVNGTPTGAGPKTF